MRKPETDKMPGMHGPMYNPRRDTRLNSYCQSCKYGGVCALCAPICNENAKSNPMKTPSLAWMITTTLVIAVLIVIIGGKVI